MLPDAHDLHQGYTHVSDGGAWQMTVTALVTSLNPAITPKRTGEDSTEVHSLQFLPAVCMV